MQNQNSNSKALNISLWIAQVVLAAMFIMAGIMKSTQPIEKLSSMLPWVTNVPEILVRIIGVCEFFGAIGILLPSLLRIQPKLTPTAATGIVIIMVLAIGLHLSRGESSVLGINIFIAVVASFIAWGRFSKAPIIAK